MARSDTQIVVDKAILDGRIQALDSEIHLTTIWTDPDVLDKIAIVSRNDAQRLEAARLRAAILAKHLTPARVAQEVQFGSDWQKFVAEWQRIADMMSRDIGSADDKTEALNAYEITFQDWQDRYNKLVSSGVTTTDKVPDVAPPPPPPVVALNRSGTGAFIAKASLAAVGVFALIKLLSR